MVRTRLRSNMHEENDILNDYRCTCGKLLFRGFLLSGSVEIKCRNCKRIRAVHGVRSMHPDPDRYVLVLATDGTVLKTSETAAAALGYRGTELQAMRVSEVIMHVDDLFFESLRLKLDRVRKSPFLFHSFDRGKRGELIPIQVSASRFQTSDGAHILFEVERKTSRTRALSLREISTPIA